MKYFACFLFLLCQCATQHEPRRFLAYFPESPESRFEPYHWHEIQMLERREVLEPLEKKRLWELYLLETKSLKPGSASFQALSKKMDGLKEVLLAKDSELEFPDRKPPLPAAVLSGSSEFTRRLQEAYYLWNKDLNEQAYSKIELIHKDKRLKEMARPEQWLKLLRMRFYVAYVLGQMDVAQKSYLEIRNQEPCATETAQLGFLMALQMYREKNHSGALQVLQEQCDSNNSILERQKRQYWTARFNENDPSSKALLEALSNEPMITYYSLLAAHRLQKVAQVFPCPLPSLRYLEESFAIPSEVHSILQQVEVAIENRLRKDASRMLLTILEKMKREKPLPVRALLYCAHLFQASGNHLEAAKIYSLLMNSFQEDPSLKDPDDAGFIVEMFPFPFLPKVEWFSRMWGVETELMYAIMRQESAFNPGAVSPANARGVMQIMPAVGRQLAKAWSYENYYNDRVLFNIEENLKVASRHLHELWQRLPHIVLVLGAYNAGLTRVENWWRRGQGLDLDFFVELIPISETRNYIKYNLRNYAYYKALRSEGTFQVTAIPFQIPPVD